MALNDINLQPFLQSPVSQGIGVFDSTLDALTRANYMNQLSTGQSIQNRYLPTSLQQGIQSKQNELAIQPQQLQAQLATEQAQANLLGSNAAINRYKLSNPYLLTDQPLIGAMMIANGGKIPMGGMSTMPSPVSPVGNLSQSLGTTIPNNGTESDSVKTKLDAIANPQSEQFVPTAYSIMSKLHAKNPQQYGDPNVVLNPNPTSPLGGEQYFQNNPLSDMIYKQVSARAASDLANAQSKNPYYLQQRYLTPTERAAVIATYGTVGIQPGEAQLLANYGVTPEQASQTLGYPAGYTTTHAPIYPPTMQTQQELQNMTMSTARTNYLTDAQNKFADIAGTQYLLPSKSGTGSLYNVKAMLTDLSLTNNATDPANIAATNKVAAALVNNALQTEQATARLQSAGARITNSNINALKNALSENVKSYIPNQPPLLTKTVNNMINSVSNGLLQSTQWGAQYATTPGLSQKTELNSGNPAIQNNTLNQLFPNAPSQKFVPNPGFIKKLNAATNQQEAMHVINALPAGQRSSAMEWFNSQVAQ